MTAHLAHALLLFGAFWPVANALLLALRGSRPLMLALAPWAAVPALLAAVIVPTTDAPITIPGALLGSEIGLDETAKTFLLFTALLWLAAGVYARAYIDKARQVRFHVFFLLTLAGNIRLIIAQDLLGFYFGYALMSFASYGLVVFERTAAAFRAARVYIVLMVASEVFLFAALVLAAHAAGGTSFSLVQKALADAEHRHLITAAALVAFGIKAGVLGLHVWLPLAHSQAPTPASAVLSGAMVKVGVLGWLRLLPIGIATPEWGTVFLVLGLAAAFYGVAMGLTQNLPKTVLAYSSVSQMGIVTAAVGMALLAQDARHSALPIIIFYALQHGLNKGALFLGAGLVGEKHRLSQWWLWCVLAIPALALAGGPWTSGMLAKLLLKKQTHNLPEFWAHLLPLVLSLTAVATALLLARFLYLIRPRAGADKPQPRSGLLAPWLILLVLAQVLPWQLAPQLPPLSGTSLFASTWPILSIAVLVVVLLRWQALQRVLNRVPQVPPGDVLVFFAALTATLGRCLALSIDWFAHLRLQSHSAAVPVLQKYAQTALTSIERALYHWRFAMVVTLLLGMLFIWQTT